MKFHKDSSMRKQFEFIHQIESGKFSLHQNGSGAHPASYPMGNRGSFLGVKEAGA
jgi:hypothetical protein